MMVGGLNGGTIIIIIALMDQLKHHTCLKGFWIKYFGPGELKLTS